MAHVADVDQVARVLEDASDALGSVGRRIAAGRMSADDTAEIRFWLGRVERVAQRTEPTTNRSVEALNRLELALDELEGAKAGIDSTWMEPDFDWNRYHNLVSAVECRTQAVAERLL